jgi:hypothetical protein
VTLFSSTPSVANTDDDDTQLVHQESIGERHQVHLDDRRKGRRPVRRPFFMNDSGLGFPPHPSLPHEFDFGTVQYPFHTQQDPTESQPGIPTEDPPFQQSAYIPGSDLYAFPPIHYPPQSQYDPNLFHTSPLTIRIPMPPSLRRSNRHLSSSAGPSGSEYNESDKSPIQHPDAQHDNDDDAPIKYTTSKRGRLIPKKNLAESTSEDDPIPPDPRDLFNESNNANIKLTRSSTRMLRSNEHDADGEDNGDDDDEEEEVAAPRRSKRSTNRARQLDGFIVSDEDSKPSNTKSRSKSKKSTTIRPNGISTKPNGPSARATRLARRTRSRASLEEEDNYQDDASHGTPTSSGGNSSLNSSSPVSHPSPVLSHRKSASPPEEEDGRPYALRQRQKINYAIPPPLEEMRGPPTHGRGGGGGRGGNEGGVGGGGGGGGTGGTGGVEVAVVVAAGVAAGEGGQRGLAGVRLAPSWGGGWGWVGMILLVFSHSFLDYGLS